MGLTDNEVAAANQQRRYEELTKSPAGGVLESATALGGAVVAVGKGLSGGPVGLAVVGSVVGAMGIVDWFRKLGTSKVNENLEALGQATEDALNRVEQALMEQGTAIDEIKRRLESEELKNAMAGASLQALRTTRQDRLKRLAQILANGVKDDDLSLDDDDDMMRAAVELTGKDVILLGKICARQSQILADARKWPMQWYDNVRRDWQTWVVNEAEEYRQGIQSYFDLNSSRSKLAAFGFIIAIPPVGTTNSPDAFPYALLPEGKRFYERLQEIAGY